MNRIPLRALWVALALGTGLAARAAAPAHASLENGLLTAEFDHGGLVSLRDHLHGEVVTFAGDQAAITINGQRLDLSSLPLQAVRRRAHTLRFTYAAGSRNVAVVYELRPGWRFLAKQVVLNLPKGATCRVDRVEVMQADLKNSVAQVHRLDDGRRGVFLRFTATPPATQPTNGLLLTLQNPFMNWQRQGGHFSMSYDPRMAWRANYGPFASDRAILAPYTLSGVEFPAQELPEWKFVPTPATAYHHATKIDWAEVHTFARCVDAFVMHHPRRTVKVHIPWCENDYQIDVSTPAGRTEYKRIIDQAAAVGCTDMLFTPENSQVSKRSENTDAWGWENVLWLGLGQKIRRGEWDPAKDPIPSSIRDMLDYAKKKHIRLMAYVYPTLGWKQNPAWTRWCHGKTGGYIGVDTGVRSFQDWFVNELVTFQRRTGIDGFSFDHWFIDYSRKDDQTPTSPYAQWYGCRRILEQLRRRLPDIVIDGRQQYQYFGPWTWVAGSYPHPTTTDEQPISFQNFPDLHFDRVSADRERWAAWWYRMEQFAPLDLVPGYMTHQTPRDNAQGVCVRDHPFRVRDWDDLGWRYSVISSIGTAPFNNVVDMLPARSEAEFKAFSPADQHWFRHWLDWTDQHRAVLRHLRPILGPPTLGRVDGTAAIVRDHGFLFLYNPNYRALDAEVPLDASIGLTAGKTFALRELYPRPGLLSGRPYAGLWHRGDRVSLRLKGPCAQVLELVPSDHLKRPTLFNATGKVQVHGHELILRNVTGKAGLTNSWLSVWLPSQERIESVRLNGAPPAYFSQNGDWVTMPVSFAGARVEHCPEIGHYDPQFTGGVYRASFTLPEAIFTQLAQRRQAWPVSYTADDLRATWLGSSRLLLYVHLAQPNDQWPVTLKLDGQPVALKRAYSAIYPVGRKRTFTGFYADFSALHPGQRYTIEVTLPHLEPGQFQGLFLENVETDYTSKLK